VEDELINLGKRHKNGEKLVMNRQLRLAAQKVRADQQAHERAVAEKSSGSAWPVNVPIGSGLSGSGQRPNAGSRNGWLL